MIALVMLAAAPAAPAPVLRFPVACVLGQDCAIQNYPDDDPGPGVRDHGCGSRTYDGHDGTDIRLASMARQRAGAAVLAAAGGTVLRVRDGVEDVSMRVRAVTNGQDCGNGVVVDHGGGWETQYCHMARGSIAVQPGRKLAAGAVLGRIGLSGNTEFPHLHLTVRYAGKAVDPFAWGRSAGRCGEGGRGLWATVLPYRRGEVLVGGFSAGPVTLEQAQDAGAEAGLRPAQATPLVAYVQAIGLEAGDRQRLTVRGPDGMILAANDAAPLDRAKAQYILFAGRKAPPGGWRRGTYTADYAVLRGGRPTLTRSFRITL